MRALIALTFALLTIAPSPAPALASVADSEIKIVHPGSPSVDLFGFGADTDGTIAIVASYTGSPPARLFDQRTGSEIRPLIPASPLGNERYVAIEGDYAIVAAFGSGARVFDIHSGAELYDVQRPDVGFGYDVDISGNLAIIASSYHAAYVFDLQTGDELLQIQEADGSAVAIDGNLALVGDDNHFGSDRGIAHLFDVSTGDLLQTFSSPDESSSYDSFGISVAIQDDLIVVGDPGAGENGAVYLFDAVSGGLLREFVPGEFSNNFGYDLSLSEDLLAVGTWNGAYVYDINTGVQVSKLQASDHDSAAMYGAFVGLSGNQFLTSAFLQDAGVGAAYLYTVPEPSALTLFTLIAALLICLRRR